MPIPISNDAFAQPQTFGRSAAVMLLLTIAATSGLRYFNPKTNKSPTTPTDKDKFTNCLLNYFPWDDVRGVDLEAEASEVLLSAEEEKKRAADMMYTSLRNPLIHAGGAVSRGFPKVTIVGKFPGLASFEENDAELCDYCRRPKLARDRFLEYDKILCKIYTRPLYWATRKMIEKFSADPAVQSDITAKLL